jgi:aubergine
MSICVLNLNLRLSPLVGEVVITDYQKETYSIDDIDFAKNPESTFYLPEQDQDVSYFEYWSRPGQKIKNKTQPLLVCRRTQEIRNPGDDRLEFLVPELCIVLLKNSLFY